LKEALEKRLAELVLEIRSYPTPIARCDLHLPALLEERTRVLSLLNSLDEKPACSPDALWVNDGGFHVA
jgi:hypothetical protein